MPTYEYACQACEHRFETFQSIKAEPMVDCPSCRKPGLRRIIGQGAGIIFKGSGFYQTDYRKPSAGDGQTNGSSSSTADDKGAKQGASSGSSSQTKTNAGAGTAKD